MHAIDLADLANTLVRYNAQLVSTDYATTRQTENSYWLTSRFRQEEWSGRLATHRERIKKAGASYRARCWGDIYPIIQEILFSEPLTRCLAYLGRLLDDRHSQPEFASLSYNALQSHIESRNRCLNLIVFGQGLPVQDAVRLNRIRRKMELYTDQLLACMLPVEAAETFCHDPIGFQQMQNELGPARMSEEATRIHTASLSETLWSSLENAIDWRSPSGRHNYRLSQSVLSMFGNNLFDSFGVTKTVRQVKYELPSPESDGNQDELWHAMNAPLEKLVEIGRQRMEEQTSKRF